MRGELQAALGDVGEVVEAAGVEHRAGQVGVGAGEQIAERQQRQRGERRNDEEQSGATAAGRDRGGGSGAAERQHDRRADVGAEAAGGEDEGGDQRDDQECRGTALPAFPVRGPGKADSAAPVPAMTSTASIASSSLPIP